MGARGSESRTVLSSSFSKQSPLSSSKQMHVYLTNPILSCSSLWRRFLKWMLRRARRKGRKGVWGNRKRRRIEVLRMLERFNLTQLRKLSRLTRIYVETQRAKRRTLDEVLGRYGAGSVNKNEPSPTDGRKGYY